MSKYETDMREVIGGIASLISEEMTSTLPIPLGDSSYAIVQMGYTDGDHEIWLRTNTDEVWILRTTRLGVDMTYRGREDERKVFDSYKKYLELSKESERFVRGATTLDVDPSIALQAWCDEVLNDEERECWNRWQPGGYATGEENKILTKYRNDI